MQEWREFEGVAHKWDAKLRSDFCGQCREMFPTALPKGCPLPAAPIVIGLGANLGCREASLRAALDLLAATPRCMLRLVSSVFESEPVGPPQPKYLNAAARLETSLSVDALFDQLQWIEDRLGRKRAERWGPRTIDLDILWSGAGAFHTPRLTVPHPRLQERAFALVPLLEVAPELTPQYARQLQALARKTRGASGGWLGLRRHCTLASPLLPGFALVEDGDRAAASICWRSAQAAVLPSL